MISFETLTLKEALKKYDFKESSVHSRSFKDLGSLVASKISHFYELFLDYALDPHQKGSDKIHLTLMKKDGIPVGVAVLDNRPKLVSSTGIYIRPEHRKQQLGPQLLKYHLEKVKPKYRVAACPYSKTVKNTLQSLGYRDLEHEYFGNDEYNLNGYIFSCFTNKKKPTRKSLTAAS